MSLISHRRCPEEGAMMVFLEMKKKLYWHLRFHKSTYQIGLMFLLAVGLVVGVNFSIDYRKEAQCEMVKRWPIIEAHVQESKITVLDTSGSRSFGRSYYLNLKVRYRSAETGQVIEARVTGEWDYRRNVGGMGQFDVGNTIKLRVNPNHPEKLSMVDITGTI